MIVPSWADQLLPQLLIKRFDTLPSHCRYIEHMYEGVWLKKKVKKKDSYEKLDNFPPIWLLYMHR